MKKAIAVLLVLVLCLSLCACGGKKTGDRAVIGTWETDPSSNSYVLVIEEDKTGSLTLSDKVTPFTWTYDKDSHTLTLSLETGTQLTLAYIEESDMLTSVEPNFTRAD